MRIKSEINFSYLGRCAVKIVDNFEQASSEGKDVNIERDLLPQRNSCVTIIGTDGALRGPTTYDNHAIHPIRPTHSIEDDIS